MASSGREWWSVNSGPRGEPAENDAADAAIAESQPLESVDLDDEEVLKDLEDPTLISHMSLMRDQHQESQQQEENAPSNSFIRSEVAIAMNDLASVIRGLDDILMDGGTACDEIHVVGTQLMRWNSSGSAVEPHFPRPLRLKGEPKEILTSTLKQACKILNQDAERIKAGHAHFKKAKNTLNSVRTKLSQSWDGYQQLCTSQESRLQAKQRLLNSASAVYDYHEKRRSTQFAEFQRTMRPAVPKKAAEQATEQAAEQAAEEAAIWSERIPEMSEVPEDEEAALSSEEAALSSDEAALSSDEAAN
jgi:hypothetical protein